MTTVPEVVTAGVADNIKVFCRVRPLLAGPVRKLVTQVHSASSIVVGGKHTFAFDWIADTDTAQDAVFEVIGKPLAQSFLAG